jgi:hypothetical protein
MPANKWAATRTSVTFPYAVTLPDAGSSGGGIRDHARSVRGIGRDAPVGYVCVEAYSRFVRWAAKGVLGHKFVWVRRSSDRALTDDWYRPIAFIPTGTRLPTVWPKRMLQSSILYADNS